MARIRKQQHDVASSTINKENWNIALYIRLSRDDGSDESLSVTNQRKILLEYVQENFQEEYNIADIYIDDGLTGTDYERPAFQKLRHDIEIGNVNCIICKNLSRAFRNYSDQGYFLESFFPLHGTRFITLSDPRIDTYLNPEAVTGLEVPINGLMNDRFAYKTSSDIRRTFDTKRRNGEFIGAFAPYGLSKDPANKNALIIDEEAAQIVRNIYQWFVYGDEMSRQGMSKEGIAHKLNDLGIPCPSYYKRQKGFRYVSPTSLLCDGYWSGRTVSSILKNKMYIGTMVQGRQQVVSYKVHECKRMPEERWYQVENTHEAIVSKELFEKAQELQLRDTRTPPNKRVNYLFSGFLKCADCGKCMTRRKSKNYVYYSCSTYKRKSKALCSKHSMRLDKLEKAVLVALQIQIALVTSPAIIVNEINAKPKIINKSKRLEQTRMLKARELEESEKLITGLYVDWKRGDITREQYRNMKLEFENKAKELKVVLRNIEDEISMLCNGVADNDPYLETFLEYKNIQAVSQAALVELVDVIRIHENGEITIVFKLVDNYLQSVESIENNGYLSKLSINM